MAGILTKLERTVFLWKHRRGVRRGLGVLSLGLGAVQLARPDAWASLTGQRADARGRRVVQTRGLRELATGVALLASRDNDLRWWRLAQQALDVGQLVGARRRPARRGGGLGSVVLATLGVAALEALVRARSATTPSREPEVPCPPLDVAAQVTVTRPPDEVFRFWRRPENLPRFMDALASARRLDAAHARWQAKGGGPALDVEIVHEERGQLLAWRARFEGRVACAGAVSFSPAADGHGTVVHVALHHRGGEGARGAALRQLFGAYPDAQLASDLERLKGVLEAETPARGAPRRTRVTPSARGRRKRA